MNPVKNPNPNPIPQPIHDPIPTEKPVQVPIPPTQKAPGREMPEAWKVGRGTEDTRELPESIDQPESD